MTQSDNTTIVNNEINNNNEENKTEISIDNNIQNKDNIEQMNIENEKVNEIEQKQNIQLEQQQENSVIEGNAIETPIEEPVLIKEEDKVEDAHVIEEPKPEEPIQSEEPKPEEPIQLEEPKSEEPIQLEETNPETPKPETPKIETPKEDDELPIIETPKESPKPVIPQPPTPKEEQVELPKIQTPKEEERPIVEESPQITAIKKIEESDNDSPSQSKHHYRESIDISVKEQLISDYVKMKSEKNINSKVLNLAVVSEEGEIGADGTIVEEPVAEARANLSHEFIVKKHCKGLTRPHETCVILADDELTWRRRGGKEFASLPLSEILTVSAKGKTVTIQGIARYKLYI